MRARTYWQILPLSPTGYGDSPYQSCSAFAGNPYFIDLDALKDEGLLTAAQLKAEKWGKTRFRWTTALSTPAATKCCAPLTPPGARCAGLHGCAAYYSRTTALRLHPVQNEGWLDDYALVHGPQRPPTA